MLQRSSSTPVFGSLNLTFTDSPNKDLDATYRLLHGNHGQESLNIIPHSTSGFFEFNPESGSFCPRRAKSEGSLERLDYSSGDIAQFLDLRTPRTSFHTHHITMLHSAPSFSIFNEGVEDGHVGEDALERTVTFGESIDAAGNPDFSFGKKCMELIQEEGEEEKERSNTRIRSSYNNDEEEVDLEPPSPPMYLAAGLGIDYSGFGTMAGGADLSSMDIDEASDPEEFHKRLVDEYPCHPLFLRNYAKFLQSKGDLQGAEDYYHRGTLADPEDSEMLLQYAKIVWDLHRDKDRAHSYLERAVQTSPQDSNVLGTYASFLWEIGDDGEEHGEQQEYQRVKEEKIMIEETKLASLSLHSPNPASEVSTDIQDINIEDYYRRTVQENPGNPSVLSDYARFLHQSKGDPEGAEVYYLQAIKADPRDGETMSQYAKLVWDLHHDHDKASHYFELAVEANPVNSVILAAYASFLWETEEDEDYNTRQDQTRASLQNGALSAINS